MLLIPSGPFVSNFREKLSNAFSFDNIYTRICIVLCIPAHIIVMTRSIVFYSRTSDYDDYHSPITNSSAARKRKSASMCAGKSFVATIPRESCSSLPAKAGIVPTELGETHTRDVSSAKKKFYRLSESEGRGEEASQFTLVEFHGGGKGSGILPISPNSWISGS